MSDEGTDLVKVGLGAGGGGALLLWLAQRVLGRALDKGDAVETKQAQQVEALQSTVHGLVGMESERKAQREELAALKATMQDVSNKLSILLDRDAQRQRRDDAVDGHLRDLDRRMGSMESRTAATEATIQQLREGGR